MSIEKNKANMRFAFEGLNKHELKWIDELCAPNFVPHYLPPTFKPDLAGYKEYVKATYTAFPDVQFVIEDVIAEGDQVVVRYTWTGTHKGKLSWMPNVPPTFKTTSVHGMVIGRCDATGKAVELWGEMDMLYVLTQLGIVPVPA
jgi:predicted ester cyclase